MKDNQLIITLIEDDFSPEEIEVLVELDEIDHKGYTIPTFNILSISMRGERLERGPFFDLLSYYLEEEVYFELKRKRKEQDSN